MRKKGGKKEHPMFLEKEKWGISNRLGGEKELA